MSTDIQITFKKKIYDVPEGFTVEEFKESLAASFPEAATAELIDDGNGQFSLKSVYKDKG